ncbi:hypothetical protein M8J75_008655 [Diaphorina citri]|nr:hypothetical protein M8J75_008655 [Diaphorina citri]
MDATSCETTVKPLEEDDNTNVQARDVQTAGPTTSKISQLSDKTVSGAKSLVLHRNTENAVVKNDFFKTSYPSLNEIISHVDTVIGRIKPVTFKPPSYLDESLVKPTVEVYDAQLPPRETISKSFFVNLRDSLVKFQVSQNIPAEAYNFISLITTICTLGCKAIHTIFIMIMALFPMIEILVHISRFLIDHLLDILHTANRQEKIRKWLIFFIEISVIFCLGLDADLNKRMVPLPILFLMGVHVLQHQVVPSYAAVNKYADLDIPSNGILPKPVQYFQHPSAEGNTEAPQEDNRKHGLSQDDRTQQARFGFNHGSSSYSGGGGIDGYSGSTSLYSPPRIDFGGLIIGAVVGLAALIIIPKIFHLFLNSIVSFIIDGSRFKSAVMIGKKGENCADAYPKCPLFEDSIASGLKKILFG